MAIVSGRADFKDDGKGNYIFTGKYMEIYISQYYFDKGASELIGDHFKTLGILNCRTFNDIEGKKPNRLRVLNLPVEIVTFPSGGYEVRKLDLTGKGEQEYYVLKYYNGDVVFPTQVAASVPTFTACMNIILSGKLPDSIPYNAVLEVWANSFDMNNVNFDVPDLVKEMIIAQVYRDPKNFGSTFGSVVGKDPHHSMYDYKTATQRELTASNSAFNGLVFEDWDAMVRAGIIGTKENKKENVSPMEEELKY